MGHFAFEQAVYRGVINFHRAKLYTFYILLNRLFQIWDFPNPYIYWLSVELEVVGNGSH
jgi:hypothetical protein